MNKDTINHYLHEYKNTGKDSSLNSLIIACDYILGRMCSRYKYDKDDRKNELRMAIQKAADKFDPTRSPNFISYLNYYLRSAMGNFNRRAINTHWKTVQYSLDCNVRGGEDSGVMTNKDLIADSTNPADLYDVNKLLDDELFSSLLTKYDATDNKGNKYWFKKCMLERMEVIC